MTHRAVVALRNAPLLLRGIYEYNVAHRFGPLAPREWMFPVTYACNARCAMCNIWQADKSAELTVGEWAQALRDPLFRSIESINLTGGEPTLLQDLPELAGLLVRLPALKRMTITSNGLLPDRVVRDCELIGRECRAHGVSLFAGISLDGIGTLHDDIRGIPGAFERVEATLDGLRGLQERGLLRCGINCTLTRRNVDSARHVREWCTQRGLPANFIVASFSDSYYGNAGEADELSITPNQQGTLLSFLQALVDESGAGSPAAYFYADLYGMIRSGAQRTTPCVFQKSGLILDARGEMQYCMYSRVLGNLRSSGARAIYLDPGNLAHRQELVDQYCAKCTITCFLEIGLAKDALRYLGFVLGRRP